MKKIFTLLAGITLLASCGNNKNTNDMNLTQEWDKTFPKSDLVEHSKVTFHYHPRSGNSTDGWNITGTMSFLNQPLMDMAGEIKTPVLLIHGEKAHSRYFSEGAFAKLKGDNKELLIIPGAVHTDLYDDVAGVMPYDKIESFFKQNM